MMIKVRMGILLVLALVLVTACSDKDKKKKSSTQSFSDEYRFIHHGCDTTLQKFQAESKEDLNDQVCEGLQNEPLNRSCARQARKTLFEIKCPGRTWTPVFNLPGGQSPGQLNPAVDLSRPAPAVVPGNGQQYSSKEQEVEDALNFSLVESYEIAEGLRASFAEFAQSFSEDMRRCGFSYTGPKCLGYVAYQGNYKLSPFQPDGKEALFLSTLQFDSIETPLVFAFDIKDENGISGNRVRVFLQLQPGGEDKSIKEYLQSSAVQLISTIKIADNFLETAKNRVASPSDIVELYSMAKQLHEINLLSPNRETSLSSYLLAQVLLNKNIVGESTESEYQYRTLSLMQDLGASKDQLIELAEVLINSDDEAVQQFAGVEILLKDGARVELKPLVSEALGHERWLTRKRALNALAGANPTLEEQNQMIGKMADEISSVRETAAAIVESLTIDQRHLDELKAIAESEHWTARRDALRLVARVSGSEASQHLIELMSDNQSTQQSVGTVREAAATLLHQREDLTVAEVPFLERQLKSEYWEVRREAAILLGGIEDKSSLHALIRNMSDNIHSEGSVGTVRDEIYKQVSRREISASEMIVLEPQLSSEFWQTRRNTAKLIGRLKREELASVALVRHMSDNGHEGGSVGTVREEIFNQLSLEDRRLSERLVENLAEQSRSQFWEVRRNVARLLNKISGDRSTLVLIAMMSDDSHQHGSVSAVRESAFNALTGRTMKPLYVNALKVELASDEWTTRRDAAVLLATIKTSEALNVLSNRLPLEPNGTVQRQIEASIAEIRK